MVQLQTYMIRGTGSLTDGNGPHRIEGSEHLQQYSFIDLEHFPHTSLCADTA
jgi:hypothetical protein